MRLVSVGYIVYFLCFSIMFSRMFIICIGFVNVIGYFGFVYILLGK